MLRADTDKLVNDQRKRKARIEKQLNTEFKKHNQIKRPFLKGEVAGLAEADVKTRQAVRYLDVLNKDISRKLSKERKEERRQRKMCK